MKKNRRAIQWLFEQLPGLVSGGVLSDESAQKLKGHYGEPAAVDTRRTSRDLPGLKAFSRNDRTMITTSKQKSGMLIGIKTPSV